MGPIILRERNSVRTSGLRTGATHKELVLPFAKEENARDAVALCERLTEYMSTCRVINGGDKVAWATSVLRFRDEGDELVAYELNVVQDEFERGVDRTVENW